MSKQHHTRFLPETQSDEARRRENSLRYAFLNCTSAIGHRPKGTAKSRFNNAARRSNATTPWELFAEPLRAVAIEAARRDTATQVETEDRIIDAVVSLMHYIMEPLDARIARDVSYLAVAKEVPEAIDAIATARLVPTPDNIAAADRESCEAAVALQLHRGGLRKPAPSFPRSMGATPPLGIA